MFNFRDYHPIEISSIKVGDNVAVIIRELNNLFFNCKIGTIEGDRFKCNRGTFLFREITQAFIYRPMPINYRRSHENTSI